MSADLALMPSDYEVGVHDGIVAERQRAAEALTFLPESFVEAAKLTHAERVQQRADSMIRTEVEIRRWLLEIQARHLARDAAVLRQGGVAGAEVLQRKADAIRSALAVHADLLAAAA